MDETREPDVSKDAWNNTTLLKTSKVATRILEQSKGYKSTEEVPVSNFVQAVKHSFEASVWIFLLDRIRPQLLRSPFKVECGYNTCSLSCARMFPYPRADLYSG